MDLASVVCKQLNHNDLFFFSATAISRLHILGRSSQSVKETSSQSLLIKKRRDIIEQQFFQGDDARIEFNFQVLNSSSPESHNSRAYLFVFSSSIGYVCKGSF